MIRINQLKLQIPHTEEALEKKIQKTLHLKNGDSFTYRIHRQSLDARRKPELFYVYTVDVTVSNENAILKHCKGNIQKVEEKHYQIPSHGTETLNARPVVIGSGPAGYTAAIYAGRADLKPVLYSGIQPGGQLTTTTIVENFPGYPNGVDGNQMMMDLKEQASRFGADIRDGSISKVDFSKRPYHIVDERGNEILADTVIIATGASAKYLGLADEEKYRGQGVSACATCDGFFYRKRTVAVVGGGDTACEEAMYLAGLAKKVYMIVRKPYLRAAEIMQQRVKEKENIEILFETNTLGLFGENGVEGAHLVKRKGESDEEKFDIAIDGFFLAIGHKPNTELFKDYIDLDEQGFIKVVPGTASTNVPGVFAAGDVADPVYRQGIVAAGSGAKAAIEADRYLQQL